MQPRAARTAALLFVVAAIAVVGSMVWPTTATSEGKTPTAAPAGVPVREHRGAPAEGAVARPRGPLGEADGAVPDGTTVFDDDVPGVEKLDADLRVALQRAATDARMTFVVNSGWRSVAYQEHLFRLAVAKYGSERTAARWVATPERSAHVWGDAVDLEPARATSWLSKHGATYGLCQIYRNEPWHYELRPAAVTHGCPAMYADATHDPRMWA